MKAFHGVDDRGRVVHERMPGNQASQNDDYSDVKNRTNDERCDDADRQVTLRIFAFFRSGRDGVKADVSEKYDRPASKNSRPSIGSEGMPIAGMDKVQTKSDKNQDRDDLQHHHHVIGFGGFSNSAHQYDGEQHHDNESRPVEAE